MKINLFKLAENARLSRQIMGYVDNNKPEDARSFILRYFPSFSMTTVNDRVILNAADFLAGLRDEQDAEFETNIIDMQQALAKLQKEQDSFSEEDAQYLYDAMTNFVTQDEDDEMTKLTPKLHDDIISYLEARKNHVLSHTEDKNLDAAYAQADKSLKLVLKTHKSIAHERLREFLEDTKKNTQRMIMHYKRKTEEAGDIVKRSQSHGKQSVLFSHDERRVAGYSKANIALLLEQLDAHEVYHEYTDGYEYERYQVFNWIIYHIDESLNGKTHESAKQNTSIDAMLGIAR